MATVNGYLVGAVVLNGSAQGQIVDLEGSTSAALNVPTAPLSITVNTAGGVTGTLAAANAPLGKLSNQSGSLSCDASTTAEVDVSINPSGLTDGAASTDGLASVTKTLAGASTTTLSAVADLSKSMTIGGESSATGQLDQSPLTRLPNLTGDVSGFATVDDAPASVTVNLAGGSNMGALTAALITQLTPLDGQTSGSGSLAAAMALTKGVVGSTGGSATVDDAPVSVVVNLMGHSDMGALTAALVSQFVHVEGDTSASALLAASMALAKNVVGSASGSLTAPDAPVGVVKHLAGSFSGTMTVPPTRLARVITSLEVAILFEEFLAEARSDDALVGQIVVETDASVEVYDNEVIATLDA